MKFLSFLNLRLKIQIKDSESAIKCKLTELLTQLSGFKFVRKR